jgi:creatinine amidohydrolase/Fe(II)-dependent formamide hydrolase-like protein
MNKSLIFLIALFSMTSTALAQQPNRQLTPEQMRARQEARQAELDAAERPIRALNSLWIEELTWMEIRDAIRDGNTTVLVLTGGVESNGPHLASGKHNYSNKLMGESVAQALGATLIAPLVTLEPGNPTGPVTIGSTGPMVSQATYIAWLTDIGDSLRSMGFTQVYFLGDSGGNRRGMQAAADELNDRYGGVPTQFHHVPEFYNHDKVRQYIQETLGIPEEMEYQASSGSDGIHEELSITSVMSVIDPTSIRFDQRVEAGRASINGISLLPLSDTQSLGRMVIDFRTRLTVEAIKTLRVGPE